MAHRHHQIVIAEDFQRTVVDRLKECGHVTILDNPAPETLIAAIPDADALLVKSKAHVTARIINAAPKLKVIGRACPNLDHIDLRAAQRRNIRVVYTPHVAVAAIAEFTLALILAVHRRLLHYNRSLRQGEFEGLRKPVGHELGNQTLGLLGLDPVAERLGKMYQAAFGGRIICHDFAAKEPVEFDGEVVGLEEFLAATDILSIHLRLSKNTRHLLNAERLSRLKPSAIVVNTSRGAVVDNVALAHALRAGRLAGAGLDVFEVEPIPANHPLRQLRGSNCILTPHVSAATDDAWAGRDNVADDVIRVLQGQTPRFPASVPDDQ